MTTITQTPEPIGRVPHDLCAVPDRGPCSLLLAFVIISIMIGRAR